MTNDSVVIMVGGHLALGKIPLEHLPIRKIIHWNNLPYIFTYYQSFWYSTG